jgi:hypothetical protein
MADNQVQILINAVDNASSKMKGVSSGLTDMVGKYLTAAGAISAVVAISKKVIDYYVEGTKKLLAYGDAIENFTRLSGASNEEAQKLIIMSERLDVAQDQLARGLKELTLNGIAPTVDNLIELGDEYRAIQDPTDKAKWAFEKFGKAGQEVTKMFSATKSQLQALSAEVAVSSVLTDQQIKGINDLEDATNRYKVALETSQKIAAAQTAQIQTTVKNNVAALLDLNSGIQNVMVRAKEALDKGIITQAEYNTILRDTNTAIGLVDESGLTLGETIDWLVQKERDHIDAINAATVASYDLFLNQKNIADVNRDGALALGEANTALDNWMISVGKVPASLEPTEVAVYDVTQYFRDLNTEMLFTMAAEGLTSDQAFELARSMGLVKEDTLKATAEQRNLRTALDNGLITLGEYNRIMGLLADNIDRIHDVTAYVNIMETKYQRTVAWGAGQTAGNFTDLPDAGGGAFYNASGASWRWIPAGYSENFAIGGGRANVSSGELHTVTRAGEKMPAEISKQSMRELASVVALQLKGILARQG